VEPNAIDWARIGEQLAAPFPPEQIEWRPSGKAAPNKRCQITAYVSVAAIEERLDAVCGVGGWAFELEPLVIDAGELRVARGRLSLFGISKDDVGTASNWEPSKGCASDCLKRAARRWGVARYLHSLPPVSVTLDSEGKISEVMLAKLREGLARRASAAA
jgi:hypothetical protein